METTMYNDGGSRGASMGRSGNSMVAAVTAAAAGNHVKALKRSMTLDLNSTVGKLTTSKRLKLSGNGSMLASPDMNMLKLASPELERMIIQQNGMVTTTPTPTQFICPKFVTEEQEAYARGFVDALEELHRKEQPGKENEDSNKIEPRVLHVLQPARPTTQSLPGIATVTGGNNTSGFYTNNLVPSSYQQSYNNIAPTSIRSNVTQPRPPYGHINGASNSSVLMNPLLNRIKEEPQTVPSTPPLSMSPINMECQETFKVERKRARNRIAARKCRHRKLERISRLEDKVCHLKGQNSDLSSTATKLREQVCHLKEQILDHVKNGCQVLMSQNLTF